MRAAWFETNGPAREVLKIGNLPDPQPGPDEVIVRVHASGVNPSDVKRRAGWNGQKLPFKLSVPNNDGAGVIAAVGENVPTSRIGERVWLHSTGWQRPLGTAAELTPTSAERAIPLPDEIPFAVGAGLGVPAMTAHRTVFGCGPVKGKTVLVTGGAGAVGFYAIQLAKWGGASVITTVSSPDKAELAKRAGADFVIDYKREAVADRIIALTNGCGVDHIVEVDFGVNLAIIVATLKSNGSVASYASMGAPTPTLPFYALMTKNVRLLWVFVYEMPREAMAEAARDIAVWLTDGNAVHPQIHDFPLVRIAEAHEAVESGVVGKVIVDMIGDDVRT